MRLHLYDLEKFIELGVSDAILAALERKGFDTPTPIQTLTIPHLLNGQTDLVAQAQTGTGKTAAFGIPVLDRLEKDFQGVQALVLTPTRELCIQVAEEMQSFAPSKNTRIVTVYGGQPIGAQMSALKRGADVVVGTPGRAIDLLKRGKLRLDQVRFVVLDEADEMLNMGFVDEVEEILKQVNPDRRMLLFSATMPKRILKLAETYMGTYDILKVEALKQTAQTVEQRYYEVRVSDKLAALCRILDATPDFYGVVFCRTKNDTSDLAQALTARGLKAEPLNGDMSQSQRELVLKKFRNRNIAILTATDVAARGIDVQDLTHVVNYSLPMEAESYVHRIGRTGRAGKQGIAISLVPPGDRRKLAAIQQVTKAKIEKCTIPSREEVLQVNVKKLHAQIANFGEETKDAEIYTDLARQLLQQHDALAAVASLLTQAIRLPEPGPAAVKPARERRERNDNASAEGKEGAYPMEDGSEGVNLRVAFGRRDNISPAQLIKFIAVEGGVKGDRLGRINIFDSFSLVQVAEQDAQKVLKKLGKPFDGEAPVVSLDRGRPHGAGSKKRSNKRFDKKRSDKKKSWRRSA